LRNGRGLGVNFAAVSDGKVEASFTCDAAFEGYSGVLHGGVISSLLDGAMTNCLFAYGHVAVTAELKVRFRHPVATGKPAKVRAWITSATSPLFELAAELVQDEQIKAIAKGKFLKKAAFRPFNKEVS
jgi:uncharacterized protein (TIGR00369 family)